MDVPKLQYEAVITVPPLKITLPRRVRRVLVSDPNIDAAEKFRGCYQMVMYYENVNQEGFGWVLAGWIVESLGVALSENPMLAGRIQKKTEGEGGDKAEMEIVSNDCGIRMAEARFSIALSDFLESSEKHDLEHELVFWKDIDEQMPEFSPLFYVQVTNFKCGGYSIGISCSLLLADFLVVDNFLKKWADIHKNQAPRNGETVTPLFYHPRLKIPEVPSPNIIRRTPYKNSGQSLLFKIASGDSESDRESAQLCVQEAEKKLQRKMGSEFSFFVKEESEVVKVETCEYSRQGLDLKNQVSSATWDEFGVYDISFHEEKRPVHMSRWIGSASEGNVVAVKHPKEGVSAVILVTLN